MQVVSQSLVMTHLGMFFLETQDANIGSQAHSFLNKWLHPGAHGDMGLVGKLPTQREWLPGSKKCLPLTHAHPGLDFGP